MRLIDITKVAQEAPIYPGADPILVEQVCDMQKGDPFNESVITMGSHMGTHGDAFCHFLKDSDMTVERMALSHYYGKCRVVTVAEKQMIDKEHLLGKIEGCERVIFHGGGYSYLNEAAAEYIVEQNITLIGTDAWSIAPLDNETSIHSIMFRHQIAVIESLELDHVEDGDYIISAFPIKLKGLDGAPVRAVLIQE